MKIIKGLLLACVVAAIFWAGAPRANAVEPLPQTAQDDRPEYELRVYSGSFFEKEPQIVTRIKVGTLFFAKSERPLTYTAEQIYNAPDAERPKVALYVVSGMLSAPKDGKFPLQAAFLDWDSPRQNLTYLPNELIVELGKPFSHYSGAVVRGYRATLSKVEKLADKPTAPAEPAK